MDDVWITVEARLWRDFMAPGRTRLTFHSLSPEKRRDLRQLIDKQKEKEFLREWEAYDRWLQH